MGRKRIRAHANPFSDDMDAPASPADVDWSAHYPFYFPPPARAAAGEEKGDGGESKQSLSDAHPHPGAQKLVTIADVGCGFGGLLVALSPLFPDELILGLEIRERVVQIDQERILKLRESSAPSSSSSPSPPSPSSFSPSSPPPPYSNVSVVHTNIMRFAANYFYPSQLRAMFVLFPDPHFKRSNHRRRVITPNFLALYAYTLRVGGKLYVCTDVRELFEWMVTCLVEHPLFERVEGSEMDDDPCVELMKTATEEGKKVSRLSGHKFPAIFRRIAGPS